MKKILLVLILLVLSGCATIHQQCTNPTTAAKYLDYDQCYAEKSAEKENLRQALAHSGDGLKNASRCSTWNGQTTCR